MKNYHFPRWCAPLVGVLVGGLCGLRAGLRAQMPLVWFALVGGVIGGLAGALILLLEPRSGQPHDGDFPVHLRQAGAENPSGVVGRFLAVAGGIFCWAPILGLVLNLVGYLVNRKSRDWARPVSLVGLVIGTLVSTLFVILLALEVID